jgi:hypothetical protein
MSLSTILKEMETNRPNADMDVQMGSEATYGGRVGLKRAATETLKRLKLQYRNELMTSTAFIVVTGDGRDSFGQLASGDNFGCFLADPEEFYKDLASRINPTLFGREGVRQLFNIAGNILEDKALELDINSYPMLMFNEKYNSAVNSVEDFVPLIRNAVNDQVGSEIVGINAIHSIVDKAIGKNHSASVTPVVLNTADEKFALDLQNNLKRLTGKVFLVVAGKASKNLYKTKEVVLVKTVSEESVGEALATIRSKILQ